MSFAERMQVPLQRFLLDTCYFAAVAARQGWGAFIRDGRVEQKWTQVELAERIPVAAATVSEWERETRRPGLEDIEPICRYLEISAWKLLLLLGIPLTPAPIDLLSPKLVRRFAQLSPSQERLILDMLDALLPANGRDPR